MWSELVEAVSKDNIWLLESPKLEGFELQSLLLLADKWAVILQIDWMRPILTHLEH